MPLENSSPAPFDLPAGKPPRTGPPENAEALDAVKQELRSLNASADPLAQLDRVVETVTRVQRDQPDWQSNMNVQDARMVMMFTMLFAFTFAMERMKRASPLEVAKLEKLRAETEKLRAEAAKLNGGSVERTVAVAEKSFVKPDVAARFQETLQKAARLQLSNVGGLGSAEIEQLSNGLTSYIDETGILIIEVSAATKVKVEELEKSGKHTELARLIDAGLVQATEFGRGTFYRATFGVKDLLAKERFGRIVKALKLDVER